MITAMRRASHGSTRAAQRLARSALSRGLATRGFDPAQAAASAAAHALPETGPSSHPSNSIPERDRLWKAAVEAAIKKQESNKAATSGASNLNSDGRPRIEKTAAPATRPFLKSSGGVERPEWMLKAAERNRRHRHPEGPTALRVALDDDAASTTTPEALAAALAAAAAPAAPEPVEPLAENPRREALWLLRVLLRHARALPEEHKRESTAQEIREMFREAQRDVRKECTMRANASSDAAANAASSSSDTTAAAASSAAAATPAAAAASSAALDSLLRSGYSRLSFLRMSTPKLQQPAIGRVPPFARARAAFGVRGESQHQAFVYTDAGTVHAREDAAAKSSHLGQSRISNSQGVTDEQIKRHQGLVERMNFRGPHWAGKAR